jgi:hypothetical protein
MTTTAAEARQQAYRTLHLVAAHAAIDPNTTVDLSSHDLKRLDLLHTQGWEWVHGPSGIDSYGLPGVDLLYPNQYYKRTGNAKISKTKAVTEFTRTCWTSYCRNNAFRLNRLRLLPAFLEPGFGGGGVQKHSLEKLFITINMSEVHEEGGETSWIGKHLEGLLKLQGLTHLTIEVKSIHEEDRDLIGRVLDEEVFPNTRRLFRRVHQANVAWIDEWGSSGPMRVWKWRSTGHYQCRWDQLCDHVDKEKRHDQFGDMMIERQQTFTLPR